jgi:ABC-2 type transport system ATP-binding protein
MNAIEVKNLTKYYGKARGIIDVSFSVPQGSIYGFIGPNGAGKSTTIRTLLSLIHATSGSAEILGMDCLKEGHKIRHSVGYVPAEVNFYDDMKVGDFLKYSAKFYDKEAKDRIKTLCERLDVDTTRQISDLSSGNKKKLAIVQALLHKPPLLILDEPTSGLDPLIQNKLYDVLREENKRGTTIFFSSHVLSEIQKMCDQVAIVKEGRILKIDSVENLRGSLYKTIRINFSDIKEMLDFEIKGSAGITLKDRQMEFIYNGDMNTLAQKLSEVSIENLWVEEPSLEDIFMHFYQKED